NARGLAVPGGCSGCVLAGHVRWAMSPRWEDSQPPSARSTIRSYSRPSCAGCGSSLGSNANVNGIGEFGCPITASALADHALQRLLNRTSLIVREVKARENGLHDGIAG